jgi:SAM-dependent methyltransferase
MGGALPLTMAGYGVRRGAARRRHRQRGEGRRNRRHRATTCQCLHRRAALHPYDGGVTDYERIGVRYSASRRPDPRIADVIAGALGDAESVVNVGAGTGSYEPTDRRVVAVEPSRVMLTQRASGTASAVRAVAEGLPFPDDAFEAAMAVLTLHHWSDPARGLAELRRVASNRAVVLSIAPDSVQSFWLTARYFPALGAWDAAHFPPIEVICSELGGTAIVTRLPIPSDCQDGFLGAFWWRPRSYLDRCPSGYLYLPANQRGRAAARRTLARPGAGEPGVAQALRPSPRAGRA